MTTPVLTKQQQRHSLSAKKGPAKGLRNILAQPNVNFWPVIGVEEYPELVTNLKTILPTIEQKSRSIPRHILKSLSKNERALARKEALEKAPPKPDILKYMIIGINKVTRSLEKDNVCSVLLDATVESPLIIKHIVTMAVNKEVPVLLLPILKLVTLEKLGFATTAFALTQEVMQCPDNACHPLYKSIAEAFKDFKLPKSLLHRFMPDDGAISETRITVMNSDTNPNISKPEKSVTVFTDVYKYRSSRDKRAFIPPTVNQSSRVSQTPSDDFIPLGSDFDSANDKNFANTAKNARYVNISKSPEVSQTPSDFIPLDNDFESASDKIFTSTSKNERYVNTDKEKKHTSESENTEKNQSFKKLKLISNNAISTKHTKNRLKRPKNDEPNYLSLKIKRIQGNNKRKKANKFNKKKELLKKGRTLDS